MEENELPGDPGALRERLSALLIANLEDQRSIAGLRSQIRVRDKKIEAIANRLDDIEDD